VKERKNTMAKYYVCPTSNINCPYWSWKHHKCAMEVMDGTGPENECDEYDAYCEEDEEDE
jgi:hypothetical protein